MTLPNFVLYLSPTCHKVMSWQTPVDFL